MFSKQYETRTLRVARNAVVIQIREMYMIGTTGAVQFNTTHSKLPETVRYNTTHSKHPERHGVQGSSLTNADGTVLFNEVFVGNLQESVERETSGYFRPVAELTVENCFIPILPMT